MKTINKSLYIIMGVLMISLCLFACNKKYEGNDTSLETLRNANNKKTYSKSKLDSLQAINVITKQKVQDLLDLSTLYVSGNKDTEIDSIIYSQMQAHFLTKDSSNLKPLLKEMDSLKVRYAKINKLDTQKKVLDKDTLDFAIFDVDYYDQKRNFITTVNRKAQYVLRATPIKFKKEFKFYFVNFYDVKNDTIQ